MARPLFGMLLPVLCAACAGSPEPPSTAIAVPTDRPLDAAHGDATAARTAALIESALAEIRPDDLRRCVEEFQRSSAGGLQLPAHGRWLIVASALPADGEPFARRRAAAPELNPEPADGWQDRVVYRALLRPAERSDPAVACLSCVFDYENAQLIYRHAYALDTCRRAVPPERDLATVMPLG